MKRGRAVDVVHRPPGAMLSPPDSDAHQQMEAISSGAPYSPHAAVCQETLQLTATQQRWLLHGLIFTCAAAHATHTMAHAWGGPANPTQPQEETDWP